MTALHSTAVVQTATPARYAKQLVSHLGRKIEFVHDPAENSWRMAFDGVSGSITVAEGELVLAAEASDADTLGRIEQALGGHLERFGQRQELTVTWLRTAA